MASNNDPPAGSNPNNSLLLSDGEAILKNLRTRRLLHVLDIMDEESSRSLSARSSFLVKEDAATIDSDLSDDDVAGAVSAPTGSTRTTIAFGGAQDDDVERTSPKDVSPSPPPPKKNSASQSCLQRAVAQLAEENLQQKRKTTFARSMAVFGVGAGVVGFSLALMFYLHKDC
ncbi:expressed unknown protein [Seminavis robusta]|uniref:Transmembrane protein n=1 Tax=Seminavis robusta TaxID=568900 RepID=A0A9N8DUR2_9STRA|nr:expressed unknown protein [Seminavis robusta]|eukprot:Sro386_g131970.1 n/a (172) ;mRNA; f:62775-63290